MRLVSSGSVWQRGTTQLLRAAYRALAGLTGEDVLAEMQRRFPSVEAVLPPSKTGTMITAALATKADTNSRPTATQDDGAADHLAGCTRQTQG